MLQLHASLIEQQDITLTGVTFVDGRQLFGDPEHLLIDVNQQTLDLDSQLRLLLRLDVFGFSDGVLESFEQCFLRLVSLLEFI